MTDTEKKYTAPMSGTAETEAFEAWMKTCDGYPFAGQFATLMRKTWMARASLAAAQVEQPEHLKHACNLWADPETLEYVIDRCDHPSSELVAAYVRVGPEILLQDENSGRDGRRYNEWHASRPDARVNAREAAESIHPPYCSGGCCNPEDAAQVEPDVDVLTQAANLMRFIDAYACDYYDEGKLGQSRIDVERELRAALSTPAPNSAARAIDEIRKAILDYHDALIRREHGHVALDTAFRSISATVAAIESIERRAE